MKRLYISISVLTLFAVSCSDQAVSLFDGKTLEGWEMDVPMMDSIPGAPKPFVVREGMLVSLGEPRGHLVSKKEYSNYRLEVEYRFPGEPGNCGILVHASTPRALYQMFPKSIEVQMQHQDAGDFWVIVEDIEVDDMVERRGPKAKWGITEGTNRRIINFTNDSERPLGEWNSMMVECLNTKIKVWVNGDLVNYGFNSTVDKGKIALQAEGAEVEFRKLVMAPIEQLTP